MDKRKGLVFFTAVSLLSPALLGAGETPAGTEKTRLEAPPETVTVTATRTPAELRELGRPVTVVTRDEVTAMGARTVAEVLAGLPAFSVAQSGSFGGPTSVFVRGGESDFNLVLIDGVPVNRPGGEYDFANLSTANIERIEIVRGPGSVLYGTEAVSSTIHIITRRHRSGSRPSGTVSVEGGSYGTLGTSAGIQAGSERIQFSLGAAHVDTDGIFDFNSTWRRTEVSGGGAFLLGARSTLTTSLRYSSARQHFPTDDTGAPVDPNDYRTAREQVYSVGLQYRSSPRWDTRLQYGYHRNDALNFTVEDGVTDFFSGVFEADDDRHYVDWQNTLMLVPGHELTAGLSWKREESRTLEETRRSAGIYLQDRMSWGDRVFLTTGVRFDDNDRFSSFVTGHADGALLVSEHLKLRAAIANGFRAPSFTEILGFPTFGITGNSDLRPEKNTAVEFGADWLRGSRTRLSGTMFFNRFSDLIEFTFFGAPGQPNFVNVEAARSRGLELEGTFPVGTSFRGGGSYTWNDTKVTDAGTDPFGNFELGRPLLRRPRHLAGVWGAWEGPRVRLRMDLRYKGSRDDRLFFPDFTSRRVRLEGYWSVDARVEFPVADYLDWDRPLSLVLRGRNLLNHGYTEIAGFPSPGRTLYGGLEFGF
ncbi:MAG: TonB-dependent vitamin B12 receptor BtuB [Acidobacteriota bacterium]